MTDHNTNIEIEEEHKQQVKNNRNILKLLLFIGAVIFIGYLVATNPGRELTKLEIAYRYTDPNGGEIDIERINCANFLIMTNCIATWTGGGRQAIFSGIANNFYNSYFMIFLIIAFIWFTVTIPYKLAKDLFLTKDENKKFELGEKIIAERVINIGELLNKPIVLLFIFLLPTLYYFFFG